MFILIPVPLQPFMIYAAAHRLLHSILGPKAPSVADLIAFEMSRRDATSIAEEYLEHHGYPTLRTCQRKLGTRGWAANGKRGRGARIGSRALRRPVAQGDPSRN